LKYNIDRELRRYCRRLPFSKEILRLSIPALRVMYKFTPFNKNVNLRSEYIISDGKKLRLDIFEPENCKKETPVLLYFHGGGFGYSASPFHKKLAAEYAAKTPCRVICPDYRLLPKYPYPAAKNDAFSSFAAVKKMFPYSAAAVGGDSAGAVLAAYTADRFGADISFLMLIYPVCANERDTESMRRFCDTPLWDSKNNKIMWEMYLKNQSDGAVPLNLRFSNPVPNAYIELCEFDCLHDEGAAMNEKLLRLGTKTVLNDTKGTFHGYDIALNSKITKENVKLRITSLKNVLYSDCERGVEI